MSEDTKPAFEPVRRRYVRVGDDLIPIGAKARARTDEIIDTTELPTAELTRLREAEDMLMAENQQMLEEIARLREIERAVVDGIAHMRKMFSLGSEQVTETATGDRPRCCYEGKQAAWWRGYQTALHDVEQRMSGAALARTTDAGATTITDTQRLDRTPPRAAPMASERDKDLNVTLNPNAPPLVTTLTPRETTGSGEPEVIGTMRECLTAQPLPRGVWLEIENARRVIAHIDALRAQLATANKRVQELETLLSENRLR